MISPPSTANTAAPRICRVSISTMALMMPRGSAISRARATQFVGILATRIVRLNTLAHLRYQLAIDQRVRSDGGDQRARRSAAQVAAYARTIDF